MDPVIPLVVCFSLALLWLVAAGQKLLSFEQFSATLADYRLIPKRLTGTCAIVVILLEASLGVGLLVPAARSASLVGSAALLALYSGAMGVNLLRCRRHIDCGCMGPAARQSLSGWLISRNLVLALLALGSLQPAVSREFLWLDVISMGAATVVLALVYATVNHLIANAPDLARIRS